jgi:serine/threonine-protein kinase
MPMNANDTTQDMPMDSEGDDRDNRLEEVFLQFLKAEDEGRPLDPRQLLEQHPDLADELREFLDPPILPPGGEPAATLPARVGRCDILGKLGRGGMGEVLEGHDTQLRRNVAVKVLLEKYRHHPELAHRFVEEARIAGQLQHPNVAPVYDLGTTSDSRPYFTMKVVKGKTLTDLLKTRRSLDEERVKFVGIFGQVCQAMAYAHARGVIHRDLKPLNVMVGAFGEVQVMDWGLAKVLPRDDAKDAGTAEETPTVIHTEGRPGAGNGTVGFMGTPAYVAPEQANGEIGPLDERADVFGLGAMLCEVLTGQAAYTGLDAEEIKAKARAADTDEALARLDRCGADGPLILLAKRCLAAEPADRPRNAGEVAAAVTAYQEAVAERLRQAELARAAEAARAEEAKATAEQERKAKEAAQAWAQAERRRRRAQLGMAAALFLLVVLAGGAGAWYRQQQLDMVRDTESALAEAAQHRDAGRWAKARVALERANFHLGGGGPATLRQQLSRATADLELVDRVEGIRERRAALVEGKFDYRPAECDYAAAFRDAGLGEEGQPAAEVATRIRASAVALQLVASLDDWAAVTTEEKRWRWLLEVARLADPDPWRNRFRDPKIWGNRNELEKMVEEVVRDESKLAKLKPQLLAPLGNRLRQLKADALPILTAAQSLYPDDYWLIAGLNQALYDAKRWDEALGTLRGVLAVRPNSAAVRNNLGAVLREKGQLNEAIREYRAAIALDSKFAWPHSNLGNALRAKGQLDEAIREYQAAIALNPKDALPHNGLGIALYDQKRLDEAIREYRAAIALDSKFAWSHSNLGNALRAKGQLDEAIREFRAAIALDPKLALLHFNLGAALRAKGQIDEAIREYQAAIVLDPKDAAPHHGLGSALQAKGQVDEAIREYHVAIALNPKDASPHDSLGTALKAKGQVDEAIREYRQAIALDPKLALPHYNLGNALRVKGQLDEAVREYRQAMALDPKDAAPHNNLGLALRAKGQLDEAIREFRAAIALDPKLAKQHYNLGLTLHDMKRLDEAIREYQAAIALDPKLALPHDGLGNAQWAKGQLDEAIREFRAAIALDPKEAAPHNNLGLALRAKGQLDEAIREFRAAIALDPKLAKPHYNLGLTLHDMKRLDEAIRVYQAAIALDPKYARPHNSLGNALRAKGQLDEAIRVYQAAIALDPKDALPHNGLGAALRAKGQLDEAIREYRAAIESDPGYARAHWNLGLALLEKGHFAEALALLKRGHELGTKQPGWRYPSEQWVRQAQQLADLDRRATDVLRGEDNAKNPSELLRLGSFCLSQKKAPAAAARLYADAFKSEPALADDLQEGDRFTAARAAALAGCGKGRDAADLDEPGRARWRKQAREWLRADLKAWTKRLDGADADGRAEVRKALQGWQRNPDLAGLRDAAALEKLSEAERAAWNGFWKDVSSLLEKHQ